MEEWVAMSEWIHPFVDVILGFRGKLLRRGLEYFHHAVHAHPGGCSATIIFGRTRHPGGCSAAIIFGRTWHPGGCSATIGFGPFALCVEAGGLLATAHLSAETQQELCLRDGDSGRVRLVV